MQGEDQLDAAFEALSSAKRRAMINSLAYRPATVSQLARQSGLSLPAMHKHVKVLEKAKLIQRKKSGRTNFVALNRRSLKTTQDWLNKYHAVWGGDNETLENYIASLKD